jgi:hypothetical protein
MTRALVTIEVNIDTAHWPVDTGLGEASNPSHPPRSRVLEAKRGLIWDSVHDLLDGQPGFIGVRAVRIPK